MPSGADAIFFVESGEHTWLQISQGIAYAMHKRGLLSTNEVHSISLKEAAAEITKGNESLVEITLASKYVSFSLCVLFVLDTDTFKFEGSG